VCVFIHLADGAVVGESLGQPPPLAQVVGRGDQAGAQVRQRTQLSNTIIIIIIIIIIIPRGGNSPGSCRSTRFCRHPESPWNRW
jgi:hypothetical protein